jgi:hypothetical protein
MTWVSWWIAAVVVCFGLSGCAGDEGPQIVMTAPPQVKLQKLKDIVPPSTLACLQEPNGASVHTIRQSAVYIIDLKKAGADCRRKLATARDLILGEQ